LKDQQQSKVPAGEIFITRNEDTLTTVVTFGVCICFYHPSHSIAAMSHFLYVEDQDGNATSSRFGRSSLHFILKDLAKENFNFSEIEVHIFGGAIPHGSGEDFVTEVEKSKEWINILVDQYGFQVTTNDLGGHRGRKILFDSSTGECIVAKVNKVRKEDWIMNFETPVYRPLD
jgi:chemotaxis protein CheD